MSTTSEKKSSGRGPLLLLGLVLGLGLYWFQSEGGKGQSPDTSMAEEKGSLKSFATGTLAGLVVQSSPKPLPTIDFADATGKPRNLSEWKGKVVVLNLWATWCTPCKKEMPDFANLQKQLGGKDFEVIALSLDRKGAEASSAFLKEVGADNLATYVEPEGKTLAAVQALGLPATLVIDKQGNEVARLLGPAKWDAAEALSLMKALMARQ